MYFYSDKSPKGKWVINLQFGGTLLILPGLVNSFSSYKQSTHVGTYAHGHTHAETCSIILHPISVEFTLDQWFSTFSVHQNYLQSLLKHRLPGPEVLIQ